MAAGKSGYLPTYNAGRMYVTPHYVEEYDAAGNYSVLKIDYVNFTSSHYEQGVNWDVAVKFNINGREYGFSGDVTTHSYTAQRCACSIVTEPIYHNDDGSKSITVTMTYAWWANSSVGYRWEDSGTLSAGTVALTAIPRASELSAANGTLGTAQTLTVDRKAGSYTHTITYVCGSASGTICTQSGDTSISWTPSMGLAAQNTTGTSVSVKLTITTYSGSTVIGSKEKTIACVIPSSVGLTVSDGWATVQPYNDGTAASAVDAFVQGYSKAKVTFDASKISTADAYGAQIAGYRITCGGTSSTNGLTEVLHTAGETEITCTVTDTRGRSVSEILTVTVEAYRQPTLSEISVFRCNSYGEETDEGTYVSVTAKGNISGIGGLNSQTMQCEIGNLVSATLQSGVTQILGGGSVLITATYKAKLTLTDMLGNTATYTQLIPTANVMFHARAGGRGAAFGKYAEADDLLDVNWQIRGRKNLDIDGHLSANSIKEVNLSNGDDIAAVYKTWRYGVQYRQDAAITVSNAPHANTGKYIFYSRLNRDILLANVHDVGFYYAGVANGFQGWEPITEAYKFTPAYQATVDTAIFGNDLLNVHLNGDFTKGNMQPCTFGTEDAGTLINSPVSSGAFYGVRHVYKVKHQVMVLLYESYPMMGRVWTHVYDPNYGTWLPTTGWACMVPYKSWPDGTSGVTDFVVAQGGSGSWSYRKWNSGYAECWAKISYTIQTKANSVVQLYFNNNFPFAFTGQPTILFGQSEVAVISHWVGGLNANSTTLTYADIGSFGSANASGKMHAYCFGKWK